MALTYVSLFGLDRARELAAESHANARKALADVDAETADLELITDFIHTRQRWAPAPASNIEARLLDPPLAAVSPNSPRTSRTALALAWKSYSTRRSSIRPSGWASANATR